MKLEFIIIKEFSPTPVTLAECIFLENCYNRYECITEVTELTKLNNKYKDLLIQCRSEDTERLLELLRRDKYHCNVSTPAVFDYFESIRHIRNFMFNYCEKSQEILTPLLNLSNNE